MSDKLTLKQFLSTGAQDLNFDAEGTNKQIETKKDDIDSKDESEYVTKYDKTRKENVTSNIESTATTNIPYDELIENQSSRNDSLQHNDMISSDIDDDNDDHEDDEDDQDDQDENNSINIEDHDENNELLLLLKEQSKELRMGVFQDQIIGLNQENDALREEMDELQRKYSLNTKMKQFLQTETKKDDIDSKDESEYVTKYELTENQSSNNEHHTNNDQDENNSIDIEDQQQAINISDTVDTLDLDELDVLNPNILDVFTEINSIIDDTWRDIVINCASNKGNAETNNKNKNKENKNKQKNKNNNNGNKDDGSNNNDNFGGSGSSGNSRDDEDEDEKKRNNKQKYGDDEKKEDEEDEEEEEEEEKKEKNKEESILNKDAEEFIPKSQLKNNLNDSLNTNELKTIDEYQCVPPIQIEDDSKSETLTTKSYFIGHKRNELMIKYEYSPNVVFRAQNNIKIPDKLISITIPSRINKKYCNLYEYVNKTTSLSDEYGILCNNGKIKIITYDFIDRESNDLLFCVLQKHQSSKNKKKWKLLDNIFDAKQIINEYKIISQRLPNSFRKQKEFKYELNKYDNIKKIISNIETMQNTIKQTKWHKIMIHKRRNNKKRLTLSFNKEEFIKTMMNYMNDIQLKNEEIRLINILMFDNSDKNINKYDIVYVWIVRIDENTDIGISLTYNEENNNMDINGIHLDKEYLLEQHELININHDCHCLDSFKSNINDLIIGNPDQYINLAKDLRKRMDDIKKNVFDLKKLVNSLKKENKRLKQQMIGKKKQ